MVGGGSGAAAGVVVVVVLLAVVCEKVKQNSQTDLGMVLCCANKQRRTPHRIFDFQFRFVGVDTPLQIFERLVFLKPPDSFPYHHL
jgi:hypothetical protein